MAGRIKSMTLAKGVKAASAMSALVIAGTLSFTALAKSQNEAENQQSLPTKEVSGQAIAAQSQEGAGEIVDTEPLAKPAKDFSQFATSAEVSAVAVSYENITAFMNSHSAIEKNRVKLNYTAMSQGGASGLARILQRLRDVPVSQLSRDDQLAYWLNMRNLLVVFSIAVDARGSIDAQRGTYEAPGELWTDEIITVEGVKLSIDDIERNILIANWNDPHILYGMYQGALGGPPLYKPGFTGANVHDVLNKLGQRYINSRKTLGAKSSTLKVPAIYEWYFDALFDGDEAKVERHIRSLALPKLAKKLQKFDAIEPVAFNYKVDSLDKLPSARKPAAQPQRSALPQNRRTQSGRSGS